MVDPSPAVLETAVLLCSALSLALGGVSLVYLFGGRGPKPSAGSGRALRWKARARAMVPASLPPLIATGILAVLLQWTAPSLGTRSEILVALLAGAGGGTLCGLLGAAIGFGLSAEKDEDAWFTPSDREERRHLIGGLAIAAGSGGAALLVFLSVYLLLGGHTPPLAAAALGSIIAAIGIEAGSSWTPWNAHAEEAVLQARWSAALSGRASRTFSAMLTVIVGAALLAYVPSVVRFLEPNAVLFPAAAAGIVLLASLGALATLRFAPPGGIRVRSHLPLVGALSFSTVALLAADSGLLYGNVGLWLSLVTGLVVAFLLVEGVAWANRADRSEASILWPSAGSSVLIGLILAAGIPTAFLLANWTGTQETAPIDPNLGSYGVALSAVSLVAICAALLPLRAPADLAGMDPRHRAAPEFENSPMIRAQGLTEGLEALRMAAAAFTALVLAWVILYLDPLEYGLSAASLLARFAWTDPSFLLGLLIGAFLPPLAVLSSARSLATPRPSVESGGSGGTMVMFSRLSVLMAICIAGPALAVIVLGPAALVGVVYGAAIGGLLLATTATGPGRSAEAGRSLTTVWLTIQGVGIAAFVVGGVWFAQALVGSL